MLQLVSDMRNWSLSLILIVAAFGLFTGCGKGNRSSNTPAVPSTQTAETPAAGQSEGQVNPAQPPPPAAAVNSEAEIAAALSTLTQAVRKYSAEKQRVPQNLGEVVSAGYVPSMPSPPTGKKFAINRKLEVILVRD